MRYYVYALVDPTNNNKPFYIGKGKGNRVKAHFKEASSNKNANLENDVEDKDIEINIGIIAENETRELYNELDKKQVESRKTKKLKELFEAGYEIVDIARIIAKELDESTAFDIEALLIKTIYGVDNLLNCVEGHNFVRFRPYNHLDFIDGFDSISSLGIKSEDQLKLMLAEGRELPLLQIEKAFPELKFNEPHFGNRLFIEADIAGAIIRILTYEINIQIELRGRKKEQRIWLRNHLKELGAENVIRRDDVFIPARWKGMNMTSDVEIAIKRVKLLLEIAKADNREQLTDEALQLIIN